MKLAAFQFYPGDWLKDTALKRCSFAAKGVWIDMLCLMSESDERGVLITGNRAWSETEIALAIGGNMDSTVGLIRELLNNGVARKRADGAIFSARMLKDEATRKARSRAGMISGGNKLLSRQNTNTLQKTEDEAGSSGGGGLGEELAAAAIYGEYPLKVGRPAAFRAINHCLRVGYDPEMLRERTILYAAAIKGTDTLIPHPSTWFNQERFNDDPSTWVRQHVNGVNGHSRDILEAKKTRMNELKRRHFSDTQSIVGGKYLPPGWRDEKAKDEYLKLKREVGEVSAQMARATL